MTGLQPVGSDIYLLDSRFMGLEGLVGVYLVDAQRPALIETSGALVAPEVISSLESAGVDSLAYVIVSHIHLDHAGGAGHILQAFPEARLVVHPLGAAHLVDPTRLHASAERVFGKEAMRAEWGYLEPVPKESILAAEDGMQLSLGNRTLEVIFTPGHSKHHLCIWDASAGAIFAGDAAGVYFPEAHYHTPTAPPPDLDPVRACESIQRLKVLDPEVIYFTHFGPASPALDYLEVAEKQYVDWLGVAREGMKLGLGSGDVARLFEERVDTARASLPPNVAEKVRRLVPSRVQAEGYLGYLARTLDATENEKKKEEP